LNTDPIAWLTTVRSSGQPDSVPVWFLWRDDEILIYSQPSQRKLKNLAENPRVSLVLDDTRGGGDVVRIEGRARTVDDHPAANDVPAYVRKYAPRIRSSFGTPKVFAQEYSVPIIVTPTRIHV
jgi:PPOX class probable F420-dependent enzyme